MRVHQQTFFSEDALANLERMTIPFVPELFILFISPEFKAPATFLQHLKHRFHQTQTLGCSTAGEIMGNNIQDGSIALTALQFEKTPIKTAQIRLEAHGMDSFLAGQHLSEQLMAPDLRHIFVLSDGLSVNGAALVEGLQSQLPSTVTITGGMAGDGDRFARTFVVYDHQIKDKEIIALGLYGKHIQIGFGSHGGWDSFGIERLVTKSSGNILYELDGEPALALYKTFLGEKAADLPASGLLFPLSMRNKEKRPVVRTILSVDEKAQSLTFAGDIPEGSYVRLMKANTDRIINGAEESALITRKAISKPPDLAILISCIGRRLVLKQMIEEEIEAVNEVFEKDVRTTGFYSYGELAPFSKDTRCKLHNQTMTITTFSE